MSRTIVVSTVLAALAVLSASPAAVASGGTPTAPAATAALSTVTLGVPRVVGGTPVTGRATLTAAAATGGVSVTLSSDDPAAATVPANVVVPAGATASSFPITMLPVQGPHSALIIGSAGTVTTYAILDVVRALPVAGSIAIIPGGTGSGTLTSVPAGISCQVGAVVSGTCSALFPVGSVVWLTARAAAGSAFQGWRGTPGCGDPSKIVVAAGTTIFCQPESTLK